MLAKVRVSGGSLCTSPTIFGNAKGSYWYEDTIVLVISKLYKIKKSVYNLIDKGSVHPPHTVSLANSYTSYLFCS